MRLVLGVAASATLAGVAALHLFWAVRGASSLGAAVPEVNGAPAFRPTRVHSVAVAVALTTGAGLMLSALGAPLGIPMILARVGCGAMGLVLAARTVGDLRLVGLFKNRSRPSRFATWDDRLYTPLCAALSVSSLVAAFG